MPSQSTLFDIQPDLTELPDCELLKLSEWIDPKQAKELFDTLQGSIAWELRQIFMFGRWVNQPRLTAFYADEGLEYHYTGSQWKALTWIEPLAAIRNRICQEFDTLINSVLCNLYRDGRDYCGWHSDFGPTDGPNPVIFSLSLGASRIFQIRHQTRSELPVTSIELPAGSLLRMGGTMQKHWKHQVPKQLGSGPRINLTFRTVLPLDTTQRP
jgi:alkylated DNA repair dioxygenase AlkB